MTDHPPIRELDSRSNDGLHVSLLWSPCDNRIWVTVIDNKTNEAFSLEVRAGEKPLEIFHHPYAYATHSPRVGQLSASSDEPNRFEEPSCRV